jgi:cytochrome b subunit of formate dehydrogenase
MKKLFLIIFIPLMVSCNFSNDKKIIFTNYPSIVIDKNTGGTFRGGTFYSIKIFNGDDVEWLNTNEEDFNRIMVNDTLKKYTIKNGYLRLTNKPTIVIMTESLNIDNNLYYRIKIFDGHDVSWYKISEEDFIKIKVGDTLKNFIIK